MAVSLRSVATSALAALAAPVGDQGFCAFNVFVRDPQGSGRLDRQARPSGRHEHGGNPFAFEHVPHQLHVGDGVAGVTKSLEGDDASDGTAADE